MSEREKIHEWIDRYNEGTLEGEELKEFLALVEADPELRRELRVDKMVNESLQDADLLEFRRALKRSIERGKSTRRLPGWLLLAASVLLVLGTAAVILFLMPWRPGTRLVKAPVRISDTTLPAGSGMVKTSHAGKRDTSGTVIETPAPVLLAANFRPLPSLESLVGEGTRTGGFKLRKPAYNIRINMGDTVRFAWDNGENTGLTLDLVDNHGKRILTFDPGIRGELDLLSSGLSPGLYYWKILGRNGLICVGKIRIK